MPSFQLRRNWISSQAMQNLKIEEFILIIQGEAMDYGSKTQNLRIVWNCSRRYCETAY